MLNLLHFEEWPAVAGSKTGSAFPEISGKNLRGENNNNQMNNSSSSNNNNNNNNNNKYRLK